MQTLNETQVETLLTAIGRIAQHCEMLGDAKRTAETADRYVSMYQQQVKDREYDRDKAIKGVAWALQMPYEKVREYIVCDIESVTVKKVEMLEVVRDLLEKRHLIDAASNIRDRDPEFVSHAVALDCYDLLMSDPAKEVAEQVQEVLGYKVQPFGDNEFMVHCSQHQWTMLQKEAAAS